VVGDDSIQPDPAFEHAGGPALLPSRIRTRIVFASELCFTRKKRGAGAPRGVKDRDVTG
jgi:hypothetical protein